MNFTERTNIAAEFATWAEEVHHFISELSTDGDGDTSNSSADSLRRTLLNIAIRNNVDAASLEVEFQARVDERMTRRRNLTQAMADNKHKQDTGDERVCSACGKPTQWDLRQSSDASAPLVETRYCTNAECYRKRSLFATE